jgi:hypothetical protein
MPLISGIFYVNTLRFLFLLLLQSKFFKNVTLSIITKCEQSDHYGFTAYAQRR